MTDKPELKDKEIIEDSLEHSRVVADIDAASLEKLRLEAEELRLRIETHESVNLRHLKLAASIGTPILAALLALSAAYIELRSVRDEREKVRIDREELKAEQGLTMKQVLARRIQSHLLSNTDRNIRLDAIREIRAYPPEIAEEAASKIAGILRGADTEEADLAINTLITIGTSRVVSELLAVVNSSQPQVALKALDAVGKLVSDEAYNGLQGLLEREDPRYSGRAKGFLISRYRERTISEANRIASGRDVRAANSYLDILTMDRESETIETISKFVSFPGDHTKYLNALNPRERALWLLFGNEILDEKKKVIREIAADSQRDISERRAAAVNLLGGESHDLATSILLPADTTAVLIDFKQGHYADIGSRLLDVPETRKLGVTMLLRDLGLGLTFGQPPASYWTLKKIDRKDFVEPLQQVLASAHDYPTYVATAALLMEMEPDTVIKSLEEHEVVGIGKAIILMESAIADERREAVDIWLRELEIGAKEDVLRWPTVSALTPWKCQ